MASQTQSQEQTPTPLEVADANDSSEQLNNLRDNDSDHDNYDSAEIGESDYPKENGRTYHAHNPGKYMLPNDNQERHRLNVQHKLFRVILDGKLYTAPLSNPRRVLDLATGTGIWATDFANEFPEATVTGIDLSPIEPADILPNCTFQIKDVEEEWNYNENFDYIHARAVVTCFKDNRAVAKQSYKFLAPGGHFELQDPCLPMRCDDGSLDGTALGKWNELLIEGMKRIGRDLQGSQRWGQHLRDEGFEHVTERRWLVPVNPWAKGTKEQQLGSLALKDMADGIAALSTAVFTRILGWEQQRLETFLADVLKDLKNKDIHAYGTIYMVYGQKPHVP